MSSPSGSDIERWEPWQREYRYGAFYVLPPAGIMEDVDALRAEHDPTSHAISSAHVSISEPLPRPLTTEDIDSLGRALSSFSPFPVTYTGPRSTDPHPGVIYWIEPQPTFRRLWDLLHGQPIFEGVDEPRRDIPAHMTIAEFVTVDESNRLAARLAGNVAIGGWTCRAVTHAAPDASSRFHPRLTLPLGTSEEHAGLH